MITSSLSPPSTYPHCSLRLSQMQLLQPPSPGQQSNHGFVSLNLPWWNASSQLFTSSGSSCVVISASLSTLFSCSLCSYWLLCYLPDLWVSLFSHPNSSSKCISSEPLSLPCPHHSITIYRPSNDRRKSRKQKYENRNIVNCHFLCVFKRVFWHLFFRTK